MAITLAIDDLELVVSYYIKLALKDTVHSTCHRLVRPGPHAQIGGDELERAATVTPRQLPFAPTNPPHLILLLLFPFPSPSSTQPLPPPPPPPRRSASGHGRRAVRRRLRQARLPAGGGAR